MRFREDRWWTDEAGAVGEAGDDVTDFPASLGLDVGSIPNLFDAQGLSTLSAEAQAQLAATLQGYLPTGASAAYNALQRLGPSALVAVNQMSKGSWVAGIETAIPVIAGCLALIPGVGTAAAGVVAAGGALFTLIADSLHLGSNPDPVYSWTAGTVGFTGLARPYGPESSTWIRLEEFAAVPANGPAPHWRLISGALSGGMSYDQIVSWDAQLLGADYTDLAGEMYALGDRTSLPAKYWAALNAREHFDVNARTASLYWPNHFKDQPIAGFFLAFDRAYMKSLEFAINGYKQPDVFGLMRSSVVAWNQTHESNAADLVIDERPPQGMFAQKVAAGLVRLLDGAPPKQQVPLKVHGGPTNAHVLHLASTRAVPPPPPRPIALHLVAGAPSHAVEAANAVNRAATVSLLTHPVVLAAGGTLATLAVLKPALVKGWLAQLGIRF